MKLYKHVSRFHVRREVTRRIEKRLIWALNLKVGDLINDCSGFNKPLIAILPQRALTRRGWFIYDVDFVTKGGGGCSLCSCGVESPLSREECEKRHMEFLEYWLKPGGGGEKWYEGLDNPKYAAQIQKDRNQLDILKNGGHISDELGVRYPD